MVNHAVKPFCDRFADFWQHAAREQKAWRDMPGVHKGSQDVARLRRQTYFQIQFSFLDLWPWSHRVPSFPNTLPTHPATNERVGTTSRSFPPANVPTLGCSASRLQNGHARR